MSFRIPTSPRTRLGFTLVEVLVVIVIMLILTAIALPVYGNLRTKARLAVAKNTMKALSIAIEKYKDDLGEYPPDGADSSTGSQMIYNYLCKRLNPQVPVPGGTGTVASASHYGPYLETNSEQFKDDGSGSGKRYLSPLGNEYSYVVIVDSDGKGRNFLLVDPGPDKDLGGSLNKTSGFVPAGDAAKDNLFSTVQKDVGP